MQPAPVVRQAKNCAEAPPFALPAFMTPDELRLVSEWLDIGAQYFNNPFDPAVPVN